MRRRPQDFQRRRPAEAEDADNDAESYPTARERSERILGAPLRPVALTRGALHLPMAFPGLPIHLHHSE
jgi:hypothetical protein